MKRSIKAWALSAAAGLAIGSSVQAASIGLNFAGGNGNEGTATTSPLPAGTSAGVIPQANWNNLTGSSGTGVALTNDAGTTSGASATYTSNNTWGRSATATDGNSILLGKYLDAGTNAGTPPTSLPANVTISGVPYATYDVYIYTRRNETAGTTDPGPNSPGFASDYTVQGVTQSVRTGDVGVTNPGGVETFASFIQATPASATSTIGNYVRFANVTGSTLTIAAGTNTNNWRTPVDGIEIVQVPEPASLGFLATAGTAGFYGLLRRRRR